MLSSSLPTRIDIIFGHGASGGNIRPIPDTSSDPNAASWTLGFPPNTFVDPGSGGEPPDGRDFNGVLNRLAAWDQWHAAGGPVFFDAAFSSSVGGYPKWAKLDNLATPGLYWISLVENNTGNPDAGAPNWLAFPPALPPLVNSFNGRTGAVGLTQSDVLNAIGPNGLPNGYLALMAAQTIKANILGGAATPQDVGFGALLTALGFTANLTGNGGWLKVPVSGGIFLAQWGAGLTSSGKLAVTFPITFGALFQVFPSCFTLTPGAWANVQNSPTNSGCVIQAWLTNTSVANITVDWLAIGRA